MSKHMGNVKTVIASMLLAAGSAQAAIVGGQSVSITYAPWQLKLYASGAGCGAVWLGARWVLTAAHCVEDASASDTYVWAGITRDRDMTNSNRTPASRIIMYATNWSNPWRDIALIQLAADITAPLARPIRYSTPADVTAGYENVGKECMASGWGGTTRNVTPFPDSLQAVTSKIHSLEPYVIHWAGQGGTANIGSCQGDSGGPLVVKDGSGNWIVAGISSFISSYCGDPNSESSYSRVSGFASWIQQQTGGITPIRPDEVPGYWISKPGKGFNLARPMNLEFSVLDLRGATLRWTRADYGAGYHAFPVAGLPAGAYTLKIQGGSGPVSGLITLP